MDEERIGTVTGRSGGEYKMKDDYIRKIVPQNVMHRLWFPLIGGGWIHRDGIEACIPSEATKIEFKDREDPAHRKNPEQPNQKDKVDEEEKGPRTHMEFDDFMDACKRNNFMHSNGRVNKEALATASGLPELNIRRAVQEKEVSKVLAEFLKGLDKPEE